MEGTSTFGSTEFDLNTGGKLSGTGNSGAVVGCSNLNLNVTNCELLIGETNDTSVTASNSRLEVTSTTTSSIDGINNAIEFFETHNANFVGNDNHIQASNSSDLDFRTEKSKVWVTDTKTCNISAKSMDIKVRDSYNVCVNGDGGKVHIEKAYNQTVTRLAAAGETIRNRISFTKCENVAKTASAAGEGFMELTDDLKKLKASTTFVSRFTLSNQSMFDIDVWSVSFLPRKEDLPLDLYEVFIKAGAASIGQTVLGSSEVELTATVEGKKHVLKFEAPKIIQYSDRYGTSGVYFRL